MSMVHALGGASFGSIRTKADVMKFALEMTADRKEDGRIVFNKKRAKNIFDFFCGLVKLPDTEALQVDDMVNLIFDKIKENLGLEHDGKEKAG